MWSVLEAANDAAFWLLIALLILQVYNIIFHKDTPNIRTAPAIRAKIIERLKQDRAERKCASYTVVDLGSGNGLFTREIAKAMPDAKVIGIEIAKTSVMWSNWLKRRAKLDNLEYKNMNFLNYDLSEPDAIVMYLLPFVMEKLGRKLHDEARPGTLITSNNFHLKADWQPEETLSIKTRYVNQRELYVYRKK